ncbi:MAG: hypothetical protein VKN13_08255 [Cyanobacteriota bacterium]|nr:hypothetical protein [Cyanobacteriota bacterium]
MGAPNPTALLVVDTDLLVDDQRDQADAVAFLEGCAQPLALSVVSVTALNQQGPMAPSLAPFRSHGASLASLPRWRQFLSRLNWRRDPDYERRMKQLDRENAREKALSA